MALTSRPALADCALNGNLCGTAPASQAPALFARAGLPMHNIGWAKDFPALLHSIRETARVLGAEPEGRAVAADMQRRLDALGVQSPSVATLYMTPGGVTSGPGSLIHEMLAAAGLTNFQNQPGWRSIPLERLAYERPGLIAAAFFGSATNHPHRWSATRHPVAQAQLLERPLVPIKGAWTACGAWFLMDAVEALAKAARELSTGEAAQ